MLISFINSWATDMGQEYYRMALGDPITSFDYSSVIDLVDGTTTPLVNGNPVDFSLDTSGQYEIVGAYEGRTNDGTPTSYLFALGPNGPVALVSQGNNSGNSVSFKPTANTTLQSGFANIANS